MNKKQRRNLEAKWKRRVKRYFILSHYEDLDDRTVGIFARTKVRCAGYCCQNQRKTENLPTFRERRDQFKVREASENIDFRIK
jgi:hypothetical protein